MTLLWFESTGVSSESESSFKDVISQFHHQFLLNLMHSRAVYKDVVYESARAPARYSASRLTFM